MADNIKLIIAVVIMITAIFVFYTYSEVSTLLRVIGLLAAAGISLFVASRSTVGARAFGYIGDAQVEVRKVVWPTRQETVQTTLLVLVMVMIMALLLWGFDTMLGWAVRALTL